MKNNDQVLLESLYNKILNEQSLEGINNNFPSKTNLRDGVVSDQNNSEVNHEKIKTDIKNIMTEERYANIGKKLSDYLEKIKTDIVEKLKLEDPSTYGKMESDDIKTYLDTYFNNIIKIF